MAEIVNKSFEFHAEWWNELTGLSRQVRIEVLEAIVSYGLTGALVGDLKPKAGAAFRRVKEMMDAKTAKSEQMRELVSRRYARRYAVGTSVATNRMPSEADFEVKESAPAPYPPTPPISLPRKETAKRARACEDAGKGEKAPAASVEDRRRAFRESLRPYEAKYGTPMIEAFFDYWAEVSDGDTRMAWEMSKSRKGTFSLPGRLATWKRRESERGTSPQAQPATPAKAMQTVSIEDFMK